jgi:hypothetical protein
VKPRIFIASSVEGKDVADAIVIGLQYDGQCTAWPQAFPLSNNTIDSLLQKFGENDFAVFVFAPDDRVTIRKTPYEAARDNVLFESGLFMGMHGKERGFVVTPQDNPSFHVPTDFAGFTTAPYDAERARRDAPGALSGAVAAIRQAIKASTWGNLRLDLKVFGRAEPSTATYPLKLYITFLNHQNAPAAIESLGYAFDRDLPPFPGTGLRPGTRYHYEFLIGKRFEDNRKDKYVPRCVIEPGQQLTTWVPIDPEFGETELNKRAAASKTGTIHYRVTWLGPALSIREFEDKV